MDFHPGVSLDKGNERVKYSPDTVGEVRLM